MGQSLAAPGTHYARKKTEAASYSAPDMLRLLSVPDVLQISGGKEGGGKDFQLVRPETTATPEALKPQGPKPVPGGVGVLRTLLRADVERGRRRWREVGPGLGKWSLGFRLWSLPVVWRSGA